MATLNVTIKEELELYGEPHGGTTLKTIESIAKSYRSIVDVTTTASGTNTIFSLSSLGLGGSSEAYGKVKYLRVSSLDEAATPVNVTLKISDASGNVFMVSLKPSESFVLFNDSVFAESSPFSNTSLTLDTLSSIEAYTASGSTKVEVFTASTN
jgi:hypothetical protein